MQSKYFSCLRGKSMARGHECCVNATMLGVAGGLLWGLYLFVMTWLAMYTGYGLFWIAQWMDLYPGYELSIAGAFIGLCYGFLAGFVALSLIGIIYKRLHKRD